MHSRSIPSSFKFWNLFIDHALMVNIVEHQNLLFTIYCCGMNSFLLDLSIGNWSHLAWCCAKIFFLLIYGTCDCFLNYCLSHISSDSWTDETTKKDVVVDSLFCLIMNFDYLSVAPDPESAFHKKVEEVGKRSGLAFYFFNKTFHFLETQNGFWISHVISCPAYWLLVTL